MHIRPKRSRLLLAPLLLAACAGAPAPPSPVADAAVAEGDETVAYPAALSAAQVLLDKALAGFGGVQRVDRLRTLVVESTMTRNLAEGQQTEIRQRSYVEFPDRFRSEAILEDMTVASVVAPGGSFLLSPFGTLPIPEEERVEIERGLARSPLSLLKGRRHETFFVQAEGDGEIDGRAVDYLRVLFIGDSGTIARRATGPDTRLYAEIGSGEVPNGALITQIVFYVRDNHASDITAHLCVSDLESVFGTGYDASCSLIGGTSGTPGETHFVSNRAETVQRRYHNGTEFRVAGYHLVFWPAEATDQLDIRMARVLWRRQISPAPGRATFGDVPKDHPFFQHVEALASSGITGGCGGGDYCPGAPVTRGQMAVFIATALGLHWPAAPAF